MKEYRERLSQAGVDPDRLLDQALEAQRRREQDSPPEDEERKEQ